MVDRILLESTPEELSDMTQLMQTTFQEYITESCKNDTFNPCSAIQHVSCFIPFALGDEDEQGGLIEFNDASPDEITRFNNAIQDFYRKGVGGVDATIDSLATKVATWRFQLSLQVLLTQRCDAEEPLVQKAIDTLVLPISKFLQETNLHNEPLADPIGYLLQNDDPVKHWICHQTLADALHLK